MLKKLLKFMVADRAIREGKKEFTLTDVVGPSPIFIAGDPTFEEMDDADHEEKLWKEKNEKPFERLLYGLNQLGYVKIRGRWFVFDHAAYQFLKARHKKIATSK